jgi:hypothetical protein
LEDLVVTNRQRAPASKRQQENSHPPAAAAFEADCVAQRTTAQFRVSQDRTAAREAKLVTYEEAAEARKRRQSPAFVQQYREHKARRKSDAQIAELMGYSLQQLKDRKRTARKNGFLRNSGWVCTSSD